MNKILLLETDVKLKKLIKQKLENSGSTVIIAEDELEALSLLAYKDFHQIISCIDLMPGAGPSQIQYKANSHRYAEQVNQVLAA